MGRLAGLPVRAHFLSYHHHYQALTLRNTPLSTTAPARDTQSLLIICVNQTLLNQHFLNPVDSRNGFKKCCIRRSHSGRVPVPANVA